MQSNILNIAQTSFKEYLFQYLAAANVLENGTIVAWYNGQPFHSAPLSLDLVHNALVKMSLGDDYGVHVTNQPLPFTPEKKIYRPVDIFGLLFSNSIAYLMAVLSASYVTFLIKVRIFRNHKNRS